MPKYSIAIANRQRALRIDRRAMAMLVRRVLGLEQVAAAEISIAFVGDAEMQAVNRQYLNHDFPTDVISFLLGATPVSGRQVTKAGSHSGKKQQVPDFRPGHNVQAAIRRGACKSIDGEIVISTETALSNASRLGTTPQHELALYLAHGLLHLCGYDDLSPREKRLMRRREAEALTFL
ncbi:MAG: rRNA maturation RNase YbeY [Planctomycetia bacterium]|nr:rRNA maturation RNase YbeY [Planctomycetia bacterium]